MTTSQTRNFEVFVTPLFDGYIGDLNFNATIEQTKNIIDQVLDALNQLLLANKTHNDLKPRNVLYRRIGNSYDIKICDFGQAGKLGGTPGWTAPVFLNERKPGKEDIYSVGWIILFLLCHSKELFHSLRNNSIEDMTRSWITRFRSLPEIDLVSKMIDLDTPLTVDEVKNEWILTKSNVKMIDKSRLLTLGVPACDLMLQSRVRFARII